MPYLKKYTPYLIIILSLGFFLLTFLPAQAQGILPACVGTGRCTLCDMVQTAINIGLYLLGIVGAIVLLFFVYGGFLMLTSGGAPDRIKKGKDVLINSVIGLGIAFLAYTVVTFAVSAVTKSGWDWQANLQCADLPAPIEYTEPTPSPEKKENEKKEGEECNASSACETNLFCDDTGHCKKKLPTGEKCYGKTIEAKQYAESQNNLNLLRYDPHVALAESTLIATKSNSACVSDDCNLVNRYGRGRCDKPAEGAGQQTTGESCRSSNDCEKGLFCEQSNICVGYLPLGAKCDGAAIDDDDRVCGRYDEVATCDNSNDLCVPGEGTGRIDDPCTDEKQCYGYRSETFCASDPDDKNWPPQAPTDETNIGKCKQKLDNGKYCDGWAVAGGNDDDACKSDNCDDGILGSNQCE